MELIKREEKKKKKRKKEDIFFFKQKTAYEIYQCDWSSDVCSSDLIIHELIHWTGHEMRCERQMLNKSGSPEYAFEELVAELGSALLCTQLNQKPVPALDHSQYIKTWLRVLKHDFSYFTEALELARTAIFYLNDLTGIYPYLKPQYQRKVKTNRVLHWTKISNKTD